MLRLAVPVAVLVLGCGGGGAPPSGVAPPIGHQVTPSISAVPAPVPVENAGEWWTRPTPCPDGATLRGTAGADLECSRDGRAHGPSTRWADGQRLFDGGLRDGQQHGLWTWYHPTGAVMLQGRWVDGVKDGVWRGWNPHGELVGHYELRMGTGSTMIWRADGSVLLRGAYVEGKKHGLWQQLGEDGSLVGEYTIEHGNGLELEWWSPGVLKFESRLEDGRYRVMKVWDPRGALVLERVFSDDGATIDLETVYRDGEVVETIDYRARRAAED
jgi:antitoxin component YwqK of YwqJK toxin-antitoxin module